MHQGERVIGARVIRKRGVEFGKIASVSDTSALTAISGSTGRRLPDIRTVDSDVVITIWALLFVAKTKSWANC